MQLFFVLTTILNAAIAYFGYETTMQEITTGQPDLFDWIVYIGVPGIAVIGAIVPWLLTENRLVAFILAILPALIVGMPFILPYLGLAAA